MRITIRSTVGLAVLAAVLATACGTASQVVPAVPTNIPALVAVQPGSSLTNYGYTPVETITKNGKVIGYVAVDCGKQTNLTTCASNLNNEGSATRPNIYVIDGKVTYLQGQHDSKIDDRSYYIAVPKAYQNFGGLTPTKQRMLLGVMPAVAQALGEPEDGTPQVVSLDIGETTAWVSRVNP